MNELQVIAIANSERARQMISSYLVFKGIPSEHITTHVFDGGWVIRLREYDSVDSYTYELKSSYKTTIEVNSTKVLVGNIKVMKRKPSSLRSRLWESDSIGSMLSGYSKESNYPKYPNMPNIWESTKKHNDIIDIMRSRQDDLYIVDKDIQDDVCRYIVNLPSIIRDEKINTILNEGNT